jgi:O-antigen ligase
VNRRPILLTSICLIGLLASLLLVGAVLAARRRVLLQTVTTFYTPLSGEAGWEGDWELSELGADPSQAGTERVTIPFVGTDFALRVRRGDYRGYLFVSVDGEPANRLPREERGAYLVLTSPDRAPQVVTIPVATRLDDGPHVAVVAAERGWDQWPLAGWSVSRAPDTTAYRRALAGLGALALACLAGASWWGARAISQLSPPPTPYSLLPTPSSILSPLTSRLRLSDGPALAATLAAAAAFYFSPWLPLTLVGGLALAVLILLRLDLGLALVAAVVPFYMRPRLLFGKAFSMAEIVTLLCALSWAARRIGQAPNPKSQIPNPNLHSPFSILHSPSSLDLAAVFFVLVALASLFAAEHRHVALRELRVVVLEPALFYLMLRTSRLGRRAVWRVVDFFVLGAVVVALIGLVQYGLGVDVITAEQGFRRLRSVYGSPNNVGLYLGRVLPVVVAVALFGATRRRRVAYGLAIMPVGLAVLLSFSKGALMLGLPLSLLALGMLAGGPWPWAWLGAVAVAALAAAPLLRTPRFASLLDTRGGTTFFRLQLWRSARAMFRDHPWLGVGLDNFLYQYRSRYILPAAWQEPDLSHPHNVLLDYASRLGLGGLVALAWLQIAFWRLALPLRRLAGGPAESSGRACAEASDYRALAIGLMGSMVDFLAHGLADASYFVIDLAFAFFLTLGLVQWLARREIDGLED